MSNPYGGPPGHGPGPGGFGPQPWVSPQQQSQQYPHGQPFGPPTGSSPFGPPTHGQGPFGPGQSAFGAGMPPVPKKTPIALILGILGAVVVVVVAGVVVIPQFVGGDLGSASDEDQIIAQFEGYAEDLGDGDWSAAADRICRDSPLRPIVQGLGLFSQTVGGGQTLDFGIDVRNVQVSGDTATVEATFDFPGLHDAPLPGAAQKVDGQWCLVK